MADEIPGGYYHELNQKGEIVKAHNAHGLEVEQLSDSELEKLAEKGEPAPLKRREDEEKEADREARRAQREAATPSKSGKK
jgi:hypothetical protein